MEGAGEVVGVADPIVGIVVLVWAETCCVREESERSEQRARARRTVLGRPQDRWALCSMEQILWRSQLYWKDWVRGVRLRELQ